MVNDDLLHGVVEEVAVALIEAFQNDNKVLLCGNGGSAADAQHIAAELAGRYLLDRKPLFAVALHDNVSYLTAVANDYSYDEVFARGIQAKGREGDVLIAISTSGNSANIIRALEEARAINMVTIGFGGQSGGKMVGLCDKIIKIPSDETPRIQEAHIMIGHIICELVEEKLFG